MKLGATGKEAICGGVLKTGPRLTGSIARGSCRVGTSSTGAPHMAALTPPPSFSPSPFTSMCPRSGRESLRTTQVEGNIPGGGVIDEGGELASGLKTEEH